MNTEFMKAEFLRPKLEGARFLEHTLPLEIARDLAAYETLVIELAKRLYMSDYPARQRVPKGFGTDFHLHLESIGEGSTIPILAVVAALSLPLGEGSHPYFERSRDLVAKCVAAKPGHIPQEFPRSLLVHFNQIGRSLRSDESLTLGYNAVLTPQRRKELVLEASNTYEREVELSGTIGEVDWENSSFRLRLEDGSQAIVPMSLHFNDDDARAYGGRNRVGIIVQAIGSFSSQDRLLKLLTVESVDIQPNYQIAAKLDSLANIENGWFEGVGYSIDRERLSTITEKFVENYPEALPLPFITPTPEGNLLFEWATEGSPSVDIDVSSMNAEFHSFAENDDVERDFSLQDTQNWSDFFLFLSENVETDSE